MSRVLLLAADVPLPLCDRSCMRRTSVTVELWNLRVGDDDLGSVSQYRARFADFDRETLRQFLFPPHRDGGIGQCCLRVTI